MSEPLMIERVPAVPERLLLASSPLLRTRLRSNPQKIPLHRLAPRPGRLGWIWRTQPGEFGRWVGPGKGLH
jgi:hypothetical protein